MGAKPNRCIYQIMAWRIHDHVTHGEIDNRKEGVVEGRLWVTGSDEPILLHLKGNCWSDLAGCLLTFRNPEPHSAGSITLAACQEGVVGDMTASRKVRVPTVSREELSRLIQEREPIPTQLGNSVYLEWFSGANGRVVLEAAHYQCELSPPEWSMEPGQEDEQRRQNEENLQDFLQHLVNQQSFLDATEDEETEEVEPLDEFQWEQLLRQSDKITEQYLEALEKYRDHPDCERLIAEAMGWDWLIEEGDLPQDNPLFEFVKDTTGEDLAECNGNHFIDEDEELDSVEDEEHPVARRARELALHLYQMTEERGLLKSQDATLLSLLTCSNATAAKIGAALSAALSDEGLPDHGFVVASLKRSLIPLHQAVAAANRMAEHIPEESEWLNRARDELFLLRQEVLRLMHDFREEL